MPPNYNLLFQGGNAGEAFGQTFQQGMQQNQQNTAKNAMAALVADPSNKGALAALAKVDPQAAMQFQQQQAQQIKAQLAQHQDSILKGAEILRQFNPKDQPSYSAALQAAQTAGVDISQVPQQYDPQYVDGVIKLADALHPESGANPHFITPQPGGGAYLYDPRTNGVQTIIQPNTGTAPMGGPLTDDQVRAMRGGGQPATPAATFP
jgi:hypothetical protein